jgi:pimeloyl-ACP methyl ester carboxylesterase
MHFYRNDQHTTVPIRWYFVDSTAPDLPFATAFNSRNWIDQSWETNDALGEVIGSPRVWVDGSPPPIKGRGRPCGSARVFLEGADAIPPVQYLPVAWGEPPCCYTSRLPGCPVLTAVNQSDPSYLSSLAGLIWSIYANNTAVQDAIADGLTRISSANSRIFRLDELLPSWSAWWDGTQALVCISGTVNFQQLLYQITSSVLPFAPAGGYGVSTFIKQSARQVQLELYAAGLPTSVPIVFCGHSFGGAIATYLTCQERILRPGRVVRCVTFGEPKSMDLNGAAIVNGVHTRIQADGDFVPQTPPNLSGFLSLIGLIGLPLFLLWYKFVWSSTGMQVEEDGSFQVPSEQPDPVDYFVGLVADVLAGRPLDISPNHDIEIYTRWLLAAAVPVPPILPDRCLAFASIKIAIETLPDVTPPDPHDFSAGGVLVGRGAAPIGLSGVIFAGGVLAGSGQAAIIPRLPLSAGGRLAEEGTAPITLTSITDLSAGGKCALTGSVPILTLTALTAGGSAGFQGSSTMANVIIIVAGGGEILRGISIVTPNTTHLTSSGQGALRGSASVNSSGSAILTSSGTWPGVAGVSSYRVTCRAAGGSGCGVDTSRDSLGGGGGGAVAISDITVTTGTGFTYHVGQGTNDGSDGENTYIGDGSQCLAAGGKGPGEGVLDQTTGCAGGQNFACIANVVAYSGGDGADGSPGTDAGGGGGGAGDAADGSNGGQPDPGTGGVAGGGDGGTGATISTAATDGNAPGGGGGGARHSGGDTPGAGARGQIELFWTF